MAAVQVGILGPLQVCSHGRTVGIGGIRLRVLLIRLALDAGRTVAVDSLALALWPDGGPADRVNALQSLVSRLRRALPEAVALRSVAGGYCLDVAPDDVDALRFDRLAREGRRALLSGESRRAADTLRGALALWRGEALSDASDAPFATAARARLDELRLAATEDRVEAELATVGQPAHLVAELEELTAAQPLRERLRVLLMRALLADGRQAEALTAFEQYRRLLAETLGTDPGPELRELHLTALRGRPATRRPSPPRQRGNLRVPLTSFVGRTDEQALLRTRLAESRLVTLVGPGGAGKTRLATTAAADLGATLAGGAWLVDLAAVTDPAGVGEAVVNALGLRDRGMIDPGMAPRSVTDRLAEALAAAETLIVLDNCEHLVDAAAQLAEDLLGRCPELRILATSREPLGLLGEALCAVRPLALPPSGASRRDAAASPAVLMFADRVHAVRPDFTVTDRNVDLVVEICRRLDGLPLAIELAAARLRSMPLEQLATRLDDRFRLLTGGSRTAVPRHRTLRSVVAWSWDLLDDPERELLEWLAVFPGSISQESAARLSTLDDDVPPGVLDTLSALVDKSLLQVVGAAQPSYRMLETIREYVLEHLAEAGEIIAARAGHARYFLDLAERAEPHLRGRDQLRHLRRLGREHDNFAAAVKFAVDTGDAETAVRLAASLALLWAIQGRHADAGTWLRRVLDLPATVSDQGAASDAPSRNGRAEPPEPALRVATAGYLLNLVLSGGYMGAGVKQESAQRWTGRPAPDDDHPVAALLEPALALIADDTVQGLATIDERLTHPDAWTQGMLRLMRAFLQNNHGNLDGARRDLLAAVAHFRSVGERWGLAMALTWLANAHTMLGDLGGAATALEESVVLLRDLDPGDDAILQRVWLAVVRAQQGDIGAARAELMDMVGGGMDTSSARYLVFAQLSLGDLARYEGDLAEAERWYDTAWRDLSRAPFYAPPFRAMVGCGRAHVAMGRGDLGEARRQLTDGLGLAVESTDFPVVAVVAVGLAWLRFEQGEVELAARTLGAAHALRGARDEYSPDVLRLIARLRDALGDAVYEAEYAAGQELDRDGALALVSGA